VVEDLEAARNNGGSSLTLYFTKESHIHTLVNLVLLSGLPIANRRIPELDYAVRSILFSPHRGVANDVYSLILRLNCMNETMDEERRIKNTLSSSR
jgi:hypothetical protein